MTDARSTPPQPSSQWKFWREARVMELEPYYCYWVSHLTSEGLHDKADIATVLAILHQQRDEMQDDALRLHREKMDALFGPDGKPRVARSESERTWIACSERLPRAGSEPGAVLGWFPQMKAPDVFPVNTVRRWHLDPDPIPGAMWMPLPEAPK